MHNCIKYKGVLNNNADYYLISFLRKLVLYFSQGHINRKQ